MCCFAVGMTKEK